MQVYQELEQIFKFRISSNDEVVPYLTKLSRMGKIDEPKKMALFTMIIDRLGKIEKDWKSLEERMEVFNSIQLDSQGRVKLDMGTVVVEVPEDFQMQRTTYPALTGSSGGAKEVTYTGDNGPDIMIGSKTQIDSIKALYNLGVKEESLVDDIKKKIVDSTEWAEQEKKRAQVNTSASEGNIIKTAVTASPEGATGLNLICDTCGKVAKSKPGLLAHKRSHNKVV